MKNSQLSQPMKHSRKTITGREVFPGQNGEYTSDQLDHFGLKIPPNCWLYFPWFAKIETQMLRYWGIAREVAINTLSVYLLCNVFGMDLRVFFLAGLIKDEVNKETVNQPLKPLREYSYYRHLWRNSRSRYRQRKKTILGKGNKRTGQQDNSFIKGKLSLISIASLDEWN